MDRALRVSLTATRVSSAVLVAWWFWDAWFQDGEVFTKPWRLLTLALMATSTLLAFAQARRSHRGAPAT